MSAPARVWLHAGDLPAMHTPLEAACLPIEGELLGQARPGDRIRFTDAAGRERILRLRARAEGGIWAESRQTTYVVPQIPLQLESADKSCAGQWASPVGRIGSIPAVPNQLLLRKGDPLLLTQPDILGRPAVIDRLGQVVSPAQIGCTFPKIFRDLRRGERILFDDGRIGGVIRDVREDSVVAEIQEEILWMCEAAHMPVIWATQVLESLAKRGVPSRAEVTDAASGVRAECVMLNKGPYIVDAVRALDDILRRMQGHQVKKRPLLRKLRLAENILPLPPVAPRRPPTAT